MGRSILTRLSIFIPVTRRENWYTRFVGKYVTGRRKRFGPHKVYIFLIRITSRVDNTRFVGKYVTGRRKRFRLRSVGKYVTGRRKRFRPHKVRYGKYVIGRRKRFEPYKVYILLITITSRVKLAMSVCLSVRMNAKILETIKASKFLRCLRSASSF